MIHKKQTEYLACWLSDSTVRGCFNETLSKKCLLLSFVFLSLTGVNKGVSEQDSDLVVVGTQELCNYSFVLGKQILQQSYQSDHQYWFFDHQKEFKLHKIKFPHIDLPWRCSERQKQYQSLAAQHTQRTVQSYQIPIYIWKSTSKSNASSLTFRELSAILGIYLKFSTELNMEQFWSDGWVSTQCIGSWN